ncbi:hypothetical protein ES703_86372 [subsurface metagenome]
MRLNGRSICPFCLKKFKHLEYYHPPSCGAFKCQKELASENFEKAARPENVAFLKGDEKLKKEASNNEKK